MTSCSNCKNWVTETRVEYASGEARVVFRSPDREGLCAVLGVPTKTEFSCNSWSFGEIHVVTDRKTGAAWQHWKYGYCPDCAGRGMQGDSTCRRCVGTGHVRFYEDGFIGEERTRRHPNDPPEPPHRELGLIIKPRRRDQEYSETGYE